MNDIMRADCLLAFILEYEPDTIIISNKCVYKLLEEKDSFMSITNNTELNKLGMMHGVYIWCGDHLVIDEYTVRVHFVSRNDEYTDMRFEYLSKFKKMKAFL